MRSWIREAGKRGFAVAALLACLCFVPHDAQAQPAPGFADDALSITTLPDGFTNTLYTSMTICAPGSSTDCRTIDRVMVDTGSTGVVILSSALGSTSLPQQNLDGNAALGECVNFFGNGFRIGWGAVKQADIQLSGEHAASVPVLVLDDPKFPDIPADCLGKENRLDLMKDMKANAILGISPLLRDCGKACEDKPLAYYRCTGFGCQRTAVAREKQLANPVAFFTKDNNGALLFVPPVLPGGAQTLSALLLFGIGTQINNALGSTTTILPVDQDGFFTTVYQGKAYTKSFIDSGAIGIHFLDPTLPHCPDFPLFYCPNASLTLSATMHGTNGTTKAVDFRVDNVEAVSTQHPEFRIYDGLAGVAVESEPELFTWGLPFFIGKVVYMAIEGKDTPAGPGPYFAF